MLIRNPLRGIIPILPTCFCPDGRLDQGSQRDLLRYYLRCAVHGMALFGNVSEQQCLSGEERTTILHWVREEVDGAMPLVVSVDGSDPEVIEMQVHQAEDYGAVAIMARPPQGITDLQSIISHYARIVQISSLPIVVQDTVLKNNLILPVGFFATLAERFPSIRYVKVEVPWSPTRCRRVFQAAMGRLLVVGGMNGQCLIEEHQAGAIASMSGSDLPKMYLSVWHCCEQAQYPTAWELFSQLLPLIRFQLQAGQGVSSIKHNLAALGIIRCPVVRNPTVELDPETIPELTHLRALVRTCNSEHDCPH